MKHKILHADDQENLRRVFKMLLKYDFPEFEIESFENGSSLEERLNGDLEGVKLVVTDNDMHPGISGSKVIMDYAQRPGFTHLPFILFYGGDASVGELAKQHGVAHTTISNIKTGKTWRHVTFGAMKIKQEQ